MNDSKTSMYSHYIFKFVGNFLTLVSGGITTLIAPKFLGPENYGIFGFTTNFFTQLYSSFDSGASMAYYTKLSQRKNEKEIIFFYFYVVTLFNVIVALSLAGGHYLDQTEKIFTNIAFKFIFMGLIYSSLFWWLQVLTKTVDALLLTHQSELVRSLSSFLKVALIILLAFFNKISLTNFFLFHYSIFIFNIISFFYILFKSGIRFNFLLHSSLIKKYLLEFWKYTHPLIAYSIVGFMGNTVQRLLLQYYGGNEEQGFYTLAYQLGAICFLFTSSMTPLYHRELSQSFQEQNLGKVKDLTEMLIPPFFLIAAFIGVFASYNAREITSIVGGDKFQSSILTIAIMFIYPIHQTYGQLVGSIYYASQETKLYRNVGVISTIIGILLSYFLIAPSNLYGLHLKSMGVATGQVLLQIITVNLLLYFIAKKIGIKAYQFFFNQLIILSILMVSMFGVSSLRVTSWTSNNFLILIFNLIFYLILSFFLLVLGQRLGIPILMRIPQNSFIQKVCGVK